MEAVVDSGAGGSVAPSWFLPLLIVPSEMSKAGGRYRAAIGVRIPNRGQQKVQLSTDENCNAGMLFQTADVERPFIAVPAFAAAENRKLLGADGGEIVRTSAGRKTKLLHRRGTYILPMWIPTRKAQDFHGQVADSDTFVCAS